MRSLRRCLGCGSEDQGTEYIRVLGDDDDMPETFSPSGSSIQHLARTPTFTPSRRAALPMAPPVQSGASAKALGRGVIFGSINAIIVLPAMVGFCTIIYQDPFFSEAGEDHAAYFPLLLKLLLLSSAVHQLAFTCLSTLPFAIGQVQDAGLIFLSSMATVIVANRGSSTDDAATMATVVVSLSLCTFSLGLMLILTGTLRLAALVRYLPFPVVGGYLAFIGQFCGQAGLALMANKDVRSITDIPDLFSDVHTVLLLLPGLVCAILLVLITSRFRHVLVLPGCLVASPNCLICMKPSPLECQPP